MAMLTASDGILLKKTPYADDKFILKILTPEKGIGSFSIKISSSAKKNSARSILGQTLPLIHFVVFGKPDADISSVRQMNIDVSYIHIPHDFMRQSVALFVNELVLQTLRMPNKDEEMYGFLKNALLLLDSDSIHLANYPLWFSVSLASYLGIGPLRPSTDEDTVFDLVSGKFMQSSVLPGVQLTPELSALLLKFICSDNIPDICIDRKDRQVLLNFMIDFFSFHADFDPRIRSADILQTVFRQ
jgi:DNA repair protein RecO (recombination protein O)